MFAEWTSLSPAIAANSSGAQSQSVLTKFSGPAGREVTVAVVKQLAANLGHTQTPLPSTLIKEYEVQWCMDVVCHGLTLPLTEHDTIKDCVSVYCDWLTALCPTPNITVPKPIVDDANVYGRKIINHFHNLFVPRLGEDADIINRQAVLCHRVLRTLHKVAQTSKVLTRESWESLLLFLLAINEILLAPPLVKDDVGDQLCERVLSVLFEVWLLACERCFPSPSLWKTLQESCALLRHRIALVEQWNRVNLVLTARLLQFSYGHLFPELRIADEDVNLLPATMTDDCVAQTWYRMLRTIGSPIALCSPAVISKTPQFMKWAALRANGQETSTHPCLLMLPSIFLKAIKGVSSLVDAFLGIYLRPPRIDDHPSTTTTSNPSLAPDFTPGPLSTISSVAASVRHSVVDFRAVIHHHHPHHHGSSYHGSTTHAGSSSFYGIGNSSATSGNYVAGSSGTSGGGVGPSLLTTSSSSTTANEAPHSPTPPLQRRLAKSFSVAPSSSQSKGLSKGSLIGLTSSRSNIPQQASTPNSGPPSTSSISSLQSLGSEFRPPLTPHRPKCNSILHLFGEWLFEAAYIGGEAWLQNTKKIATEASRRPSSMVMDARKGSLSISQPSSLSDIVDPLFAHITIDKYESGRAEAIGALCRIFCAKKTNEEILPVYLARFYMALQQGLKIPESKTCEETMASILCNSADLFRLDLDGVHVVLPAFVAALELVLPDPDLKMRLPQHGNSAPGAMALQKNELRRASIHLLLSILALPLHFQSLPIRELSSGPVDKLITFEQLKPRLVNILMNAVRIETDAQNTHMLLGGLLLCVQDSVLFEKSESTADSFHQSSPGHSDANLLSSACSEKSVGSSVGSSSLGGHSAATTTGGSGLTGGNHDYPSLGSTSDGMPSDLMAELEMIPFFDNAHALFVHATYLVCHRLISTWKTDLNVSLAALELLSGLARMHIKDSDALECKRAVKWICDYIFYQCQRPPQAHSKDLHSTIVAAFQCSSAWLMQHPYLLQDKDCLTTVLEVVELGISGSKSVGKPGEPNKLKEEKELKPASIRVREAAETLLTIILEQVGNYPTECGPQSTSSLLDEVILYKYCNSSGADGVNGQVTHEQAIQKFRYFVTENSTIMALLEEPLGNDQDPQPTVTMLLRGPFGRNAWTMQLRHLPRSKSGKKYHAANPGRPVPMNEMPQKPDPDLKHFPDSVDRVQPCAADFSIPTLEKVIEKMGSDNTKRLVDLIERQTVHEKLAWAETESSDDSLGHAQEAQAPNVCHEFQAARLFLAHFGLLSIGAAADESNEASRKTDHGDTQEMRSAATPILTVLDTKKPGFADDLQLLDKLSPRTNDTMHIFYVRAGQTTAQQIIDNMNDGNVALLDPSFWSILQGLGNPVDVAEHAGWTGFVHNSWRIKGNAHTDRSDGYDHGRTFDGERQVLYWADVGSEIAFVVPTKWNRLDEGGVTDEAIASNASASSSTDGSGVDKFPGSFDRSLSVMPQSGPNRTPIGQKPRTLSLELEGRNRAQSASTNTQQSSTSSSSSAEPVAPSRRRVGTSKSPLCPAAKIMLVWLESYEDHLTFPLDDLLVYSRTGEEPQSGSMVRASDCHVIFLHALASGLLRVKLQGPVGRMSFATPLVDGMVLSKRVVGSLVRQTVYNMAKRRRLDNDLFQPPHVRRRIKVQDLVQKYSVPMKEPELLAHLFKNVD